MQTTVLNAMRLPSNRLLGVTILLCLMISVAYAAGPAGQRKAPVVVADVVRTELAPTVSFSGTIISDLNALIPSEIGARVISVRNVGDRVSKNESLAILDETFARDTVREQQAEVRKHKARLEFFGKERKRLQRLAKSNNAAQSQLDQVKSDQAATEAELAAAQARLSRAQEQFERLKVRAPFPGIVTERLVKPGEWVKEGDGIVRLVNDSQREIKVWVSRPVFDVLATGDRVRFDREGKAGDGPVTRIVSVADPVSRLYEVRVGVTEGDWRIGESVRVHLPTGTARVVMAVPRDALVIRRTGTAVFRLDEGDIARKTAVTTGMAAGELIEVRSNVLKEGDRVVVRGGERLREGQAVKLYSDNR